MTSEIAPYLSREEQELAQKRAELAILEAELTDRELFLANLRAELASFEGRYLREVGVLYAELDEWNAKLAEFAAEAAGTEDALTAATEARAQAGATHAAAYGDAAQASSFLPSPELKKLYREVVNQVHPDRAADEVDRTLRERLMKEATAAYRRGDAAALQGILEAYRCSPESVRGVGSTADLQRVLRQIQRIARRLAEIESAVEELTSSEIALLMAKVEVAAASGRSLLAEMAASVQRRILAASREFAELTSKDVLR